MAFFTVFISIRRGRRTASIYLVVFGGGSSSLNNAHRLILYYILLSPNLSANSVYSVYAVYKIILANFFNVRAKKNHPCIALLLPCLLGHPSPKSWYDRIKLIRHHLSKWFGGGIRRRFLKRKLQVVLMFEAAVAFFHWCGFQNCCSCWNLVIALEEEEDDDDGGIWAHP